MLRTIYYMNDRQFERGDTVYIRDYPMGKPLMIYGKIVGFVGQENYNVKMQNGLQEGTIVLYNVLRLIAEKDAKWYLTQEK